MKRFAIDASLNGISLALDADAEVRIRVQATPMATFQEMAQLTSELFDEASCGLDEIEEVTLATGPGSFTGIKIGWSFAFGLFCNLTPKWREVCSLELLSRKLARPIIWPMTKTHAFAFLNQPQLINLHDPQQVTALRELKNIGLCGKHWVLAEELGFSWDQISAEEAATVIAQELLENNNSCKDHATIPPPNYMRLSTAEEKRQRSSSGT